MSDNHLDRRDLLKGALGAAAAVGAFTARSPLAAADGRSPDDGDRRPHPIRLGGPIFDKTGDPEELAKAHRKLGYRAAYCPGVKLDDKERIKAITEAYARNDVVIAEVGRWVNMMDADPEKRKANIQTVTDGLALADALGARCCVDIAGSFSTEAWYGPHPDNFSAKFFDAAVENARKIIDAVKPKRSRFCYEMMGWAIPDSPDAYLRLIKAVDRPAFGVHLDVANLVNSPQRFYRNTDLINECFDKLGSHITSCHAKDLVWDVEMNVHFREVPAGAGKLDLATYIRRLAQLPGDAPLMIEHCAGPAEYDQARQHLLDLGAKVGVGFGQG